MRCFVFILIRLPAFSFASIEGNISELPITKLYKKADGKILYWEIWEETEANKLVYHFGALGQTGEAFEIVEWDLQRRKYIYDTQIQHKILEGYKKPDSLHQMIIQFPTDDSWGGRVDLKFRNKMWDELNECLGWTGNGAVHGGDIGSGSANLFFDAVDPHIAVQSIVAYLNAKGIKKKFRIAVEVPTRNDDVEIKVLCPENFKGQFIY